MIRAVHIISEGQTEEEFINNSLTPYLNNKGVYDVRAILIPTSSGHKGGDINYSRYKKSVINLLKRETNILVTSLIDFFKLQNDFPKYKDAQTIPDKENRVDFLEKAISEQIDNNRFVPYIQLHEFEALLFAGSAGIDYFPEISENNKNVFYQIEDNYPNPELLNDGKDTAPSKRLKKIIPGYQKNIHGPIMALEIGIENILDRCPRFRDWVSKIIKIAKSSK